MTGSTLSGITWITKTNTSIAYLISWFSYTRLKYANNLFDMTRLIYCFTFLGLFLAIGCKPKFDEASQKQGPVTEAVFASGSIEPKDAYTLTALFDGFIQK